MESGNGGDSSEGVCITVADSDDFLRALAILQRSYLYEESKQLFTYNSAFVVKNAQLEEKYKAFCTKKRHAGYSEEDLKETYGFLLFDDVEKANALGEKGLLTGNSDLTTLGDPSKGVYISMYSDCLDPNRWCHPKSGHIVIIKLTRGKIKSVTENYTQTLTTPTEGFDCHVSEHLSSVSSQTSSFLAFERTQYYIYEHPLNGSRETALSPSAACPLAIVSFSYMNSKTTVAAPQGTREEEKPSGIYWPWRGQLQIGSKSFTVGLRSKAGALIPVKLSPVLKVCRAISVSDLQRSLPRTGFKTCLTGEAFLDGLYCNLFELVPSQEEQKDSFSLLLSSIQEKNVALSVPLVDGGFLLLMHSSQFIQNDDASSEGNNVLQSLFVFPQSRLALRAGTDFEHKNSALSSVVLQLAPALNYGECEVERLTTDCSEELCDVLLQHLQNYNQRTNSKTMSPSSEEYDTHQCSCTQRNNTRTLQRLTSYLSRPGSFQLPLSKVSEILLAEMEEQREDLEEDVYVFPSSSECMGLEDRLDTPNVSVMNVWPPTKHENNKLKDLQAEDLSVQNKPGTIVSKLNKVLDVVGKELHTSHSQTHPAEFIVTISTAEQGVAVETVNLQLPMVPVNSLNHETGRTVSDCTEAICLTKSKEKRPARGPPKKRKLVSSALVATPIVDMSKTPVEDSNDKEKPEKNQQISDTWKWKMKKTSPKCKTVEAVTVAHGQPSLQSTFLKELELQPMEKTEHQLPVISHCGQILVPFGYVCTANEMKSLKRKLSTNDKQEPKKPLISASVETELHFPTMDGINVTKSTDVAPREGDLNTGVSSLDSVPLNPEHEKSDDSLLKSQEIDVVYDKPIGALCPDKSLKKRCISLAKLKSVFAKRERHTEVLTKEMTSNNVQDTPLISTSETTATTSLSLTSREVDKGDHKISDLVLNDISSSVPNQMLLNETSTELEKSEVEKCGFQSSPKSRSQVRKHTNKRHGIRRCPKKIKTLKMPPGIPGERFKREWWLHCGPSAFPESETPQNKDGSQNNSLRNAANKEENKVFSPTDALNLLAELALGDNSNTLPLHPKTALEQKSKTNENNLDLMKNTITEQQSVFRLLLRENTTQVPPHLRSPSPRPLVGNRESVALVFKEHAYASPLPSTPLSVSPTFLQQVSLVCGAPKMRLNHLKPCMDENKSSYPPVSTEDQSEPNRTQEYPKENVHFNQKFRNSRVFVDEGGSLRVTRQWPGKYDFSLDSRIAIGQVEKAVSRVLHGPWAFPPQEDSCVRLIIHLWIGLFYSRSTPRWVHVDLDFTYSSTTLDVGSLANSSDSPLDLSKKSSPASDQEPVIWDLSLPNAVTPDHDVGRNETSVSIEKMMGMEKINSPKSTPEPHKSHGNFAQSETTVSKRETRTNAPDVLSQKHPEDLSSEDDCVILESQEESMNRVSVVGVSPKHKQKLPQYIQEVDGFSKTTEKQIVEMDVTKSVEVKDGGTEKVCDDVGNGERDKKGSEDKIKNQQIDNIRSAEQTHGNDAAHQQSDVMQSSRDKIQLGFLDLAVKDCEDVKSCSENAKKMSFSSALCLNKELGNVSVKVSTSPTNVHNEKENSVKSQSADLNKPLHNEATCLLGLFANQTFPHTENSSDHAIFSVDDKQDQEWENKLFGRTFIPFIGLDIPVADGLFLNSPQMDCVEFSHDKTLPTVVWKNESDSRSSTPTVDEKQFKSLASCSNWMNNLKSVSRSGGQANEESSVERNLSDIVVPKRHLSPSNVSDMKTRLQDVSRWMEQLSSTNGSNLFKITSLKEFLDSVPAPRSNHMSYFLNRRHVSTSQCYDTNNSNYSFMASNTTSEPHNLLSHDFTQFCSNKLMLGENWKSAAAQDYPTTNHQQGNAGGSNKFPSIAIFPDEGSPLNCWTPVSIFSDGRIKKANFKASKNILERNVSKSKSKSSKWELVNLIKQLSQHYLKADLTQGSLQKECLIFLEQIKRLVKKSIKGNARHQVSSDNTAMCSCSALTSNLCSHKDQQEKFLEHKLEVEKFKRTCLTCKGEKKEGFPVKDSPLVAGATIESAALGGVIAECAQQFEAALHKICGIAQFPVKTEVFRMHPGPNTHFEYCGSMKRKLDEDFESDMNSLVKASCTTKYRFYILVTAEDNIFKAVREQLEAEGHTAVAPSEFFTKDISSSLHIILRNEDIAKHICEVPDLLKLKKSPHVLFAGIDTSADVVNLTHRELFVRGGFIVIDRAALQHLNLCSMNKILEILKMLNRKGKWKWMLHHRDSRRLKEDASTSAEAKEKCLLLSRGQEAALLKVLPYHECDLMSQDQPDYLTCLVRLQVQKISYRYAVCVTDRSHEALERNGILTVTMNSFLTKWPSEAFTLRPQAPSSVTSAEAVQF